MGKAHLAHVAGGPRSLLLLLVTSRPVPSVLLAAELPLEREPLAALGGPPYPLRSRSRGSCECDDDEAGRDGGCMMNGLVLADEPEGPPCAFDDDDDDEIDLGKPGTVGEREVGKNECECECECDERVELECEGGKVGDGVARAFWCDGERGSCGRPSVVGEARGCCRRGWGCARCDERWSPFEPPPPWTDAVGDKRPPPPLGNMCVLSTGRPVPLPRPVPPAPRPASPGSVPSSA